MKPFNFTGIHHAAFATADMNRTIEYWRDLLGFPLAVTFNTREGKQYAFALPGKMLIYFFEWPEVEPHRPKRHGQPVTGPFHFDHIALGLTTMNELYRLQDQLAESDLPVSDIFDHGYIHSIYTFDPNGIPLEFNCLAMQIDFLEKPVLVDISPVLEAQLGAAPVPGKWPSAEEDDMDRVIIASEDRDIFLT